MALVVIQDIFAVAHPLSVYLRGKDVDLASAMTQADKLTELLGETRDKAEERFHGLYQTAEILAAQIGEELKMPRYCYETGKS